MKLATRFIHAANQPDAATGATTVPIHQTAAYAYDTAEELEAVFSGRAPGYVYSRISNPTVSHFEQRLTAIEGGRAALAGASGMAAISAAILTLAQAGDEIVAAASIFGGSYSLLNRTLRRYGITPRFIDPLNQDSLEAAINDRSKLIFVETIGNPKLDVPDVAAIAEIARRHQVALLVDSTATTPYLIRPRELGANLVLHSISKYLTGNGSCIGGIMVDCGNFKWGDAERYREVLGEYQKLGDFSFMAALRNWIHRDLGGCLAPLNAFLAELGLDTLPVRLERQCQTAHQLALALHQDSRIAEVGYPGLPGHPSQATAARQFNDRFGALLTLRLGSKERCFRFINELQMILQITNLGDAKTMMVHPASTFARDATEQERLRMGITDDLVRCSVGLEDVDDLRQDIGQALEKLSCS